MARIYRRRKNSGVVHWMPQCGFFPAKNYEEITNVQKAEGFSQCTGCTYLATPRQETFTEETQKRNQQIRRGFARGASIKQLSQKWRLTDERIRQVLVQGGMDQYRKRREARQQVLINRALKICLPLCREKKRRLNMAEVRKAVPLRLRYGVDPAAILKALGKAGFKPGKKGVKPKYTNEELLQSLKELALELGHTPTKIEMEKHGLASFATYVSRFESLSKTQRLAGLQPNHRGGLKGPSPLPAFLKKE